MTQDERKQRLEELREELLSPTSTRSREAIIIEGKTLRLAFNLYNRKHPKENTLI